MNETKRRKCSNFIAKFEESNCNRDFAVNQLRVMVTININLFGYRLGLIHNVNNSVSADKNN